MIALDELAVRSQRSSVVFVALWLSLFTIPIPASTASQRCDVNIKALQLKPACRLFSQLTVYCSWAITRPSRVGHNGTNTNRNPISLWVAHCPFSPRREREVAFMSAEWAFSARHYISFHKWSLFSSPWRGAFRGKECTTILSPTISCYSFSFMMTQRDMLDAS